MKRALKTNQDYPIIICRFLLIRDSARREHEITLIRPLWITGLLLLFIGYFGLARLTSEVSALWTFRIILYGGLLTGAAYAVIRITR